MHCVSWKAGDGCKTFLPWNSTPPPLLLPPSPSPLPPLKLCGVFCHTAPPKTFTEKRAREKLPVESFPFYKCKYTNFMWNLIGITLSWKFASTETVVIERKAKAAAMLARTLSPCFTENVLLYCVHCKWRAGENPTWMSGSLLFIPRNETVIISKTEL